MTPFLTIFETSSSSADVCLHYFGRLCTQTQLQSVARHSVAFLPRRRRVFFIWQLPNTMRSKKTGCMGRCVLIQAISSRELFCQNIIPAFLILLLATDLRVVKNNDFPFCKISKGQNDGKHLGVCWKWRGCWRRCHRRDAASRAAIPPDYEPK